MNYLENTLKIIYNFTMGKTAPLSTVIDADVKKAVAEYCRRRGLKLRYFIEQALVEQIEDAIDLEAWHERRDEDLIGLEDILASRKKKKR